MRFYGISKEFLNTMKDAIPAFLSVYDDEDFTPFLYCLVTQGDVLAAVGETLAGGGTEPQPPVGVSAVAVAVPLGEDTLHFLTGSGINLDGEEVAYMTPDEGSRVDELGRRAKLYLSEVTQMALASDATWIGEFLEAQSPEAVEPAKKPPIQRTEPATTASLKEAAPSKSDLSNSSQHASKKRGEANALGKGSPQYVSAHQVAACELGRVSKMYYEAGNEHLGRIYAERAEEHKKKVREAKEASEAKQASIPGIERILINDKPLDALGVTEIIEVSDYVEDHQGQSGKYLHCEHEGREFLVYSKEPELGLQNLSRILKNKYGLRGEPEIRVLSGAEVEALMESVIDEVD